MIGGMFSSHWIEYTNKQINCCNVKYCFKYMIDLWYLNMYATFAIHILKIFSMDIIKQSVNL